MGTGVAVVAGLGLTLSDGVGVGEGVGSTVTVGDGVGLGDTVTMGVGNAEGVGAASGSASHMAYRVVSFERGNRSSGLYAVPLPFAAVFQPAKTYPGRDRPPAPIIVILPPDGLVTDEGPVPVPLFASYVRVYSLFHWAYKVVSSANVNVSPAL